MSRSIASTFDAALDCQDDRPFHLFLAICFGLAPLIYLYWIAAWTQPRSLGPASRPTVVFSTAPMGRLIELKW